MKRKGRTAEPLTDKQLSAVREYLESNLSYDEVADKHGINKPALRYWVTKYRKQQEQQGGDTV